MKKTLMSILLLFCFLMTGCGKNVTSSSTPSPSPTTVELPNAPATTKSQTVEDEILYFVNEFNSNSKEKLEFVEDFVPSDNSNSHYRTEFRLGAYSDAVGKSYSFNKVTVDIVGKQSILGDISLRVYMYNASIDQCIKMVRYASPIMDSAIHTDELQKTIDYITEHKTANGYYFANLALLMLGNDTDGYEFMLKMGND